MVNPPASSGPPQPPTPDRPSADPLIADEVLRERVRHLMASEREARQGSAFPRFSRNPLAPVLLSFLLTTLIGSYIGYRYTRGLAIEADAARSREAGAERTFAAWKDSSARAATLERDSLTRVYEERQEARRLLAEAERLRLEQDLRVSGDLAVQRYREASASLTRQEEAGRLSAAAAIQFADSVSLNLAQMARAARLYWRELQPGIAAYRARSAGVVQIPVSLERLGSLRAAWHAQMDSTQQGVLFATGQICRHFRPRAREAVTTFRTLTDEDMSAVDRLLEREYTSVRVAVQFHEEWVAAQRLSDSLFQVAEGWPAAERIPLLDAARAAGEQAQRGRQALDGILAEIRADGNRDLEVAATVSALERRVARVPVALSASREPLPEPSVGVVPPRDHSALADYGALCAP